jgi:hypothetical protein
MHKILTNPWIIILGAALLALLALSGSPGSSGTPAITPATICI